jgi:hypothetical protein
LETIHDVSCSLKTFTITALTKKKEVEEETIITVQKTPDDTEKKRQEGKEVQELFSKKIIEEEITVEVIPHQGVQAEGIKFPLFLCIL